MKVLLLTILLANPLWYADRDQPRIPAEPCDTHATVPGYTLPPATDIWVPLILAPAIGEYGTDVEIQYDPDVVWVWDVRPTAITDAAGYCFVSNATIPGRVLVSMYTCREPWGFTGGESGAIFEFEMTTVGQPGTSAVLEIYRIEIDEGAYFVCKHDGGVEVVE